MRNVRLLTIEKEVPIEPPADNEQKSNKPSHAGLSSPTRTGGRVNFVSQ